jgi:hypothetical protein
MRPAGVRHRVYFPDQHAAESAAAFAANAVQNRKGVHNSFFNRKAPCGSVEATFDPHIWSFLRMAMSKSDGGSRTVNKSAITGRFVTDRTVKNHPKTTVKQTVKKK